MPAHPRVTAAGAAAVAVAGRDLVQQPVESPAPGLRPQHETDHLRGELYIDALIGSAAQRAAPDPGAGRPGPGQHPAANASPKRTPEGSAKSPYAGRGLPPSAPPRRQSGGGPGPAGPPRSAGSPPDDLTISEDVAYGEPGPWKPNSPTCTLRTGQRRAYHQPARQHDDQPLGTRRISPRATRRWPDEEQGRWWAPGGRRRACQSSGAPGRQDREWGADDDQRVTFPHTQVIRLKVHQRADKEDGCARGAVTDAELAVKPA
jgi:hypothetical protein